MSNNLRLLARCEANQVSDLEIIQALAISIKYKFDLAEYLLEEVPPKDYLECCWLVINREDFGIYLLTSKQRYEYRDYKDALELNEQHYEGKFQNLEDYLVATDREYFKDSKGLIHVLYAY